MGEKTITMDQVKCHIIVYGGVIPGDDTEEYTRKWFFTQEDLDNPPTYVDQQGAAMNYAMSLQDPKRLNWVKLEWVWY